MVNSSSGATPPTGPSGPHANQGAEEAKKESGASKGDLFAKPMTFLGMYFTAPEAKKLWNVIIQQINAQIKKDQDRALKAIRKLRKSETGDDSDD